MHATLARTLSLLMDMPQHYAWAAGHVLFLITSIRYLLAWIFFRSSYYGRWYSGMYSRLTVCN